MALRLLLMRTVPLTSAYTPRHPEDSLLYRIVAGQLETFLARQRERDRPVPGFVEREFRSFLTCGVLEHGFFTSHVYAVRQRPVVGIFVQASRVLSRLLRAADGRYCSASHRPCESGGAGPSVGILAIRVEIPRSLRFGSVHRSTRDHDWNGIRILAAACARYRNS